MLGIIGGTGLTQLTNLEITHRKVARTPYGEPSGALTFGHSGVGVIMLPATDLYLMGRRDERNVRRGLAPARRLLAAGVPVAAATNNVRNAFTPVGNADLPLMGYLLAVGAHMGTPQGLRDALAMITEHPARILRLDGHGLAVGCRADLVVWETARPEDVVAALTPRRLVVKRGRVSVEHSHAVRERWREA